MLSSRFGNLCAFLALTVVLFFASMVDAQTSAFTYQGRLTDTSLPASSTYQMRFALYDAPAGGAQIGSTIENTAVAVSNGVFTVQLDYGPATFPGPDRYLEISVRRNSGEAYVVLSPRQRVTSAPYAIRASSAGNADNASSLGGTSASNFHTGTGSANVIAKYTSPNTLGNSSVTDDGMTLTTTTAVDVTGGSGTSYPGASIEVRTANTPRISFHWPGVVASQLGMDSAGVIRTYNNPGSGFEQFAASNIYANGFLSINGVQNSSGNIRFAAANPYIVASSYFIAPGGAYFNSGTVYFESQAQFRNGIHNDSGPLLTIAGGTAGLTYIPGTLGIGTSAPEQTLHVVGSEILSTGGGAGFKFRNRGSSSSADDWVWYSMGNVARFFRAGPGDLIGVTTAGSVGIGTMTPTDRLQVIGDIRVGTGGTNGCLKNFGGAAIAGSCSSDARLKRDIAPFLPTLDRLAQLRPVHFYWRAQEFPELAFGREQSYGLIAQEVELIFPELVAKDERGFRMVDYSRLPLITLQAVKELKQENERLAATITEQRDLMEIQQADIDSLKKLVCLDHPNAQVCNKDR